MKKIFEMLSVAILAVIFGFALVSCGGDGNANKPEPPSGGDGAVEYTALVRHGTDVDFSEVINAISQKSGRMMKIVGDENAPTEGEIVFGDADRTVSEAAAALLEDTLDREDTDGSFIGYVIYKDRSGGIAVYWSDDYAKDMAIECFINEYADLSLLASLAAGVVKSECFSLDEHLYNAAWAEIEKTAPAEVTAALKSLSEMFDGSAIADWMANLWEPYLCVCGKCEKEGREIACYGGAFYYANSSRDHEGFLPDMENTAFVLGWIAGNGAFSEYGNSYAKALPDEIKNKIIKFVQALQYESDGYFYHPQWGNKVNTDRRGRDLSNAVTVLKNLGAKPLYPTALDRLQNNSTASVLTAPLCGSAATAVSAVIGTASSFEESLKSEETYLAWLKEITKGDGMFESTAGAHVINAGKSQIEAAGYLEVTLNYLDEKQEQLFNEMQAAHEKDPEKNPAPTGLWQRTADYNAVWGLLKFAPFYSSGNREIKYAEHAIRTCVSVIMIDHEESGNYHMNDVYNQWSGASNLISNVKKHNPELLPKIYEITNENAVLMIRKSMEKLSHFIHDDGTYGYNQGTSAPSLYGTSVSLGLAEGDVNATILASGMYRSVFSVLGYPVVHMCDYRDGERFIDTILNLQSVEKIPAKNNDPLSFEDEDMSGVTVGFNSGGTAEIVDDPKSSSNKALRVINHAGANDAVSFSAGGSMMSNCYIFETDMMVESANVSYITQIYIGNCYMIDVLYQGGKIKLRDNATNTGTAHVTPIEFSADLGEWFKLRVECYTNINDPSDPTFKIYRDGVLVSVSSNFYGSHVEGSAMSTSFTSVRFWSMRAAETVMYLDNVYVGRENKQLTDETPEKPEEEKPEGTQIIRYDFTDGISPSSGSSGDEIKVVTDPENPANKLLSINGVRTATSQAGAIFDMPLTTGGTADAVKKAVSFDMNITARDLNGNGIQNELVGDFLLDSGNLIIHHFNLYGGSHLIRVSVELVKDGNGIVTGYRLVVIEGTKANEKLDLVISLGEMHSFKFEITFDAEGCQSMTIFVDGTAVHTTENFVANATKYEKTADFSMKVFCLKRTLGISYFDNVTYSESTEKVAR